ncbi:M16 family metallopeptidase [Azospirillum thermophilum]|uniref:Insulinase family protein n=1 Tax=Azospirillum thermophilum TaxID=2202148 RepID=A0A2S2CZ37_9PROT|nr:pitrilysin family protein [Azospirillum thermophilum]AWK89705.1 insulinase family protein [Azospirillum thermophilum]
MSIQLSTLPNGFRVLTDHLPHLGTITSGVWVGVGARNERPEVNGIAHFLEHMIFKGTASRDALAIALEIENRGGEFNAFTDYDVTAYYAQMASTHVEVSCDIIGDIVLNSVFPQEEVEKERGVVIQEIGRYADEPEDVVYEALRRTAFQGQALGRPILGPRENVAGFGREHLLDYVAHYDPRRMVYVVSGNVDHDTVVRRAEALFGHLTPKDAPFQERVANTGGAALLQREAEQVHFMAAFPGAGIDDADSYPLRHLANILGGGMTSRLFQEIREKRGLVYSVYSAPLQYQDGGALSFYAGTGVEEVAELVPVFFEELRKARDGVTEAELQRSKEQLRFSVGKSLESTMRRADRFARTLLRTGEIRSIEQIFERIDSVTPADVAAVANRVFAGPMAVSAVGVLDHLPSYEDMQGMLKAA